MQSIVLAFIVFFSFSVSAELSPEIDAIVLKSQAEVHKARFELVGRTRDFNFQETQLQNLLNVKDEDFKKALDNLGISPSERQDVELWHKNQDFKRLNGYIRKKLLQIYSRYAFDRKSWEMLFSQSFPYEKELESYHQDLTQKNHNFAKEQSQFIGISFLELKKNIPLVQKFCADLPKGGILHTHPYGTMDRSTVQKVLEIFNPLIDRNSIEKYTQGITERVHPREVQFLKATYYDTPRLYKDIRSAFPSDAEKIVDFFFVPRDSSLFTEGVTPFSRFLAAFSLPLEMLGILNGNVDNQIALEQIIYDDMFLRSLTNRVSYLEITRNLPVLKNSRQYVDRYNDLLAWTEGVVGVMPRTLVSFNRTNLDTDEKRLQQVTTMSQLLRMKASSYVLGINLMGDESLVSALDAAQFIYGKLLLENEVRNTGLQATIHAGESGDIKNLRDALVFGVKRMGHGILFMKSPLYLELARREQIALELNLSSNEVLQVATIANNPFLYFHRLGIPVSLSTDDEGMFLTTPNEECVLAILQTDIEYVELKDMMLNSIKTSFADDVTKAQLIKVLRKDLEDFEQRWKNISP